MLTEQLAWETIPMSITLSPSQKGAQQKPVICELFQRAVINPLLEMQIRQLNLNSLAANEKEKMDEDL